MSKLIFSKESILLFSQKNDISKDIVDSLENDKDQIFLKKDTDYYFFTRSNVGIELFENQLIIVNWDDRFLKNLNERALNKVFERINTFITCINRKQLCVPENWNQHTFKNYITFFAYPEMYGTERIIIVYNIDNTNDIYICSSSASNSKINLDEYVYNAEEYKKIKNKIPEVISEAKQRLESEASIYSGTNSFYLDHIGNKSIIKGYSFASWIPLLSTQQKQFLNCTVDKSVKLRGPAGSGKTLVMELKAIKLSHEYPDSRILFSTHSWSVAEEVQLAIDSLNDQNTAKNIDVFPLISIIEDSREKNNALKLRGIDSYTGKQEQQQIIKTVLDEFKNEWFTFKKEASVNLKKQIEQEQYLDSFISDLLIEFTCVFGANGIMPGINSENKYLQLAREKWMMNLESQYDKKIIYYIYTKFIGYLTSRGEMSTDQAVNDYLNYLSTYAWFYKRKTMGYDFIFVDEMHLFNEQERMVFHWLSKDPQRYPVIFMSLDPKQSILEKYTGDILIEDKENQIKYADETYGSYESIQLTSTFRYTEKIFEFIDHIDKSYPTLFVNKEWLTSEKINVNSQEGETPIIKVLNKESEEKDYVLSKSKELITLFNSVCLLIVDVNFFSSIRAAVVNDPKYKVIESREDTINLKYSKKTIVISQPEYVAGLQFSSVILAGLNPNQDFSSINQSYNFRRYLSNIYLGATRAIEQLTLSMIIDKYQVPDVLQRAIELKLLEKT